MTRKSVFFSSSFRAFLFFILTQKKSFQTTKSSYFCVGQQKKRTAQKELVKRSAKKELVKRTAISGHANRLNISML